MIMLAEISPEMAAVLAWSTLILWIGIALPILRNLRDSPRLDAGPP